MEFRCVECGYRIGEKKALYIQYSPGNIRLLKCVNCKSVADQYIECEIMILLIDLMLHKPKAYRHLLFNLLNQQLVNFRILTDLLLGNFIFLYSLVFLTRFFCDATMEVSRYKEILLAIFISSYLKIFPIAMMVWEFPSSVLLITDIFVLSSNTVALKVVTEASMDKCIGACVSAHVIKLVFKWLLNMMTSPSSLYNQNICWKNLVSGFLDNQPIGLGQLSPT